MKLSRLLLALAMVFPASAPARSGPEVVVTVAPIHSLVAGVMQGAGEPRLLLPGGASPHAYALLPSDARALSRADLVVWVGPELERFMVKALRNLAGEAESLEVAELAGLTLLQAREAEDWEQAHSEEGHEHDGADMHLWLDPQNAARIVQAVAAKLAALDPANAQTYLRNAGRLEQRLQALDARTRQALAPVRQRPYVVFHDAYHYFEHRYDLHAVATVTVSPERQPGARQITRIRERIVELGVSCVFREPQFEADLVQALVRGTAVKVGVLDPVGAQLEPGPEAYFQLIDGMTKSLVECLR